MATTVTIYRLCVDADMENRHTHREKQDHQALLKAKYCPRVAAASGTQKTPKTHVTFDP